MSEQMPQGTNYSYNAYAGGAAPQPSATAPARPKKVDVSFWLLIISVLINVVSLPVGIAIMNSADNRSLMQSQFAAQGLSVDVDAAVAGGIVFLMVVGIISIVINLLVAIFIRKGHNWARIVLTVFAVLSLLNLMAGVTPLGIAGIVLLLSATVLLYLAPSPEYFTAMKQYRQSKKLS